MKKSFKLLSAALFALASFVSAQADELTINDGAYTNYNVPIEGQYADTQGCAVQTIYPESQVATMTGGFIQSMKFYIADEAGNKLDGGTLAVSVGTTTQTSFPSYNPTVITGLTHVADVTMTTGETEVVVNFDTPFVYEGGNLVVEFLVSSATSNYGYVNFYGENADVNNACIKHNYSSSAAAFYPKTTFEYEAVEDMAAISAREMAFGKLFLDNEATMTITLKNMGKNAFTPVFGALQAPFSLETAAAEVAPGESMDITVKFTAAAVGDYAQTLTIDCGAAGQFEVAITGEAAELPLQVVVADDNATSGYLPVYGYYYDTANSKQQMIYPGDMLADLVGKKVTAITFHPTAGLSYGGGKLQLSFKTVEQIGFTGYEALSDLEVVATMVPTKGDTELTFVLDEPFEYTGGNLAIETLNIETGSYGNTSFYGVNMTDYYPSFYAYGYSQTDVSHFLPKASFTYMKEDAPEPQGLRGDVNNDGDVNIADVTALIDYLLSQDASGINLDNADCNLDTEVNIADVTALIDFLLSNAWPAK